MTNSLNEAMMATETGRKRLNDWRAERDQLARAYPGAARLYEADAEEARTTDFVVYHLHYLGHNEQVRAGVVDAILRLPEPMRAFALENCCFLDVGGRISGITWHAADIVDLSPLDYPDPTRVVSGLREAMRDRWVILLDATASELPATMAHEIAHAWLGHRCDWSQNATARADIDEWQACLLARECGLTGRAADPEDTEASLRPS